MTGGQLSITDSVTITGPANGITIDGNNASRIFNIGDGSLATSIDVQFSRLSSLMLISTAMGSAHPIQRRAGFDCSGPIADAAAQVAKARRWRIGANKANQQVSQDFP